VRVTASGASDGTRPATIYRATVMPAYRGAAVPTRRIAFRDHGHPIPGCATKVLRRSGTVAIATCAMRYQRRATRQISAAYTGDKNFLGSTSATQKITR
jgi:hypothetical protein